MWGEKCLLWVGVRRLFASEGVEIVPGAVCKFIDAAGGEKGSSWSLQEVVPRNLAPPLGSLVVTPWVFRYD